MKNATKFTAAIAIAALCVTPVLAKPDHANKGKGGGKAEQHQSHNTDSTADRVGDAIVNGLLTAAEKALIGNYYSEPAHYVGAKPLPPGIAKNVARGKPLPPGIAKRGVSDDLLRQLNKRDGIQPRIVGTDLVLEEIATGIIIDVLREVIR